MCGGGNAAARWKPLWREAKEIIAAGYKEITLLGQNVNSYGKDLPEPVSFAQLLRTIDALPGDFKIRFMTSHPKDATKELIDVIAESRKVSHHLHLPVQSGSNRILKAMNRHYTREQYLDLVAYAKKRIPEPFPDLRYHCGLPWGNAGGL